MRNITALLDVLEIRRSQAIHRANQKKTALWREIPRLAEIDRETAAAGMQLFEDRIHKKASAQADYDACIRNLTKESAAILEAHHIKAEDLEPKFHCMLCKDTGFVNGEKCQCLKEMISEHLFASCDLSSAARKISFEQFDCSLFPDEFQARAKKTKNFGLYYCAHFHEEGNYVFTGKAGRGKTFLCSCIAATLINDGHHVIYITASHLADLVRNHAAFDRQAETELLYRSLNECDLLMIDDFGAEYQTDFSQRALFEIINDRLLKERKLIISTNLSMNEVAAQYDVRLSSRLRGHFKQLTFPWGDMRVKKSK